MPDRSWIEFEEPRVGETIRTWAPRMAGLSVLVVISLTPSDTSDWLRFGLIGLLTGLMVLMAVSDAHRASEAQKRARLLADAEYQHWCILRGDDRIGVFGTRYQPPPLETHVQS